MEISFQYKAFVEYTEWGVSDKKIFTKINKLIKEIVRTPFEGTGKPEALKHDMKGLWSRRITGEHRLVYEVNKENIIIYSCKGHYKK